MPELAAQCSRWQRTTSMRGPASSSTHYRSMGGLYGSEYWPYTLVGQTRALELTASCQPIGTRAASEIGFLDGAFGEDTLAFMAELRERARRLARDSEFRLMLRRKHERRIDDESVKPRELSRRRAGADADQFIRGRPRQSPGPSALRLQREPPPQKSRTPISQADERTSSGLPQGTSRRLSEDVGLAALSRADAVAWQQIDPDRPEMGLLGCPSW